MGFGFRVQGLRCGVYGFMGLGSRGVLGVSFTG